MSEETTPLPSFSIVVPTWGDYQGLGRTLCNTIYQSDLAKDVLRDIMVVGDGFEEEAEQMCAAANTFAQEQKQNAKVWYFHLKGNSGTGNIPRAAGLKRAKQDWVLFVDAGTSVTYNAFATLVNGIQQFPASRIISWDMVQLLDPVPIVTSCALLGRADRSKGLPYVIPGCAAAIRREDAQLVEWPNVGASDWAYYSMLWEAMYGKPEDETPEVTERINKEILLIPWVLTVAYGARTNRKERAPLSNQEFSDLGYGLAWQKATSTVVEPPAEPDKEAVVVN